MADYQRPKDGFRFAFVGVNTRDTADSLPPGKFTAAQNIRSTGSNSVRTRPGYVSLFTTGSNAVTDIRGYTAIQTDALPRFLARDSAGMIWLDNNNSVGNLAGNAGFGASMLTFRPSESPQSWMYIGQQGDYQKFSAPGASNNVTQYKVGIAEPQQAVDAVPLVIQFTDMTGGNANWTANGAAGNVTSFFRANDSLTAIVQDPVAGVRFSVGIANNANGNYAPGEVIFNGSTGCLLQDVIPALPSGLTVAASYYSNNVCTVVPSAAVPEGYEILSQLSQLRRGALVNVGGNNAIVLGTIPGPNGNMAFQVATSGNVAGNIAGINTLVFSAVNGGSVAQSVGLSSNISLGNNNNISAIGTLTQVFATNPFGAPYTQGPTYAGNGNAIAQLDDYVHLSVSFSDPTQLIQLLVMFTLDPGGNNYNGDLYYYAVRPGDLVGIINGNTSALPAMLLAAENLIIGQLPTAENIAAPGQSSAGNNQWAEVIFPVSALTRVGGNQSLSLADCTGVQLKVNVANNITFNWGSFWVGGGGVPDVGNNGSPYSYQVVPLSSSTGVRGNPTPVMHYGVNPQRQPVLVKTSSLNYSYDPQIDTWEINRYGGSVTSYRFIGTSPVGQDFIDNVFDDSATAGSPLVIDNTEPWPSIDVPWRQTSGVAAAGPFLTVTGAALPANMNHWLPGTIFQVGGQEAYTLRSRPVVSGNTATFEFDECVGSGNQSSIFVLEPNIANQPLPYLWGPNEQGYVFGCGDLLRPGTVSWCKAYAPDAVPTGYDLDLCPPSEPLLGGEVLSGISLAASSARWWALYFQAGGTPLYSPVEVSIGKRLASPFGKCTDGASLYFWATDCIARTGPTGPAVSLTDADLFNLFPHGGLSGKNVVRGAVTYYAPDYSRAATFRLSVREGIIHALYQDSTGTPRMLVGQVKADGEVAWSQDAYAATMTAVYSIEQPKGTLEIAPSLYPAIVMGSNNGHVWKLQDFTNDGGNAGGNNITGYVYTPEWDGGDLRAAYQWGDQFIDVLAISNMTITPVFQGNNIAANTTITANANRQYSPISLGGGSLVQSIGLQITWTDNFNNSNTGTHLYSWQPSFVEKPETIQDRFGDWYDFGQASYVRGLVIHADTSGNNKNISIRNADTNNLVSFSGGPANGQINHNGEQEKAYYFNPPFVSHMVRDEAQDKVPWRKFQFEWVKDAWPELSRLPSPWLNLGQDGAKYVRGAVIPMDTNGNNVSLTFISSDGGNQTVGPFNTTASEKTAVGWAFTTPLIGHDFQIVPSNDVRLWIEEIRWDAEVWPELITETTPWMDLGSQGAKYIRGVVLPIDTGGNNTTLTFTSPSGSSQAYIVNATGSIKTPYPIAFSTPFVCESLQITTLTACRIWFNEARWDADPWPELIPEASAWFSMGTPGTKYLRGAVIPMDTGGNNVSINFISSDGANISLPANTAANVKTPVAFAFSVPLIGHEFQLVPSANNSVRIWSEEVQWIFDKWPEITKEASPWMDLGAQGAKYLRGAVIPMDTGGNAVSLTFYSSDGGNNTVGPFTTTAGQKTAVPWAFSIPLIGHDFQLIPSNNVRLWSDEIRWDFDAWPELINEATGWLPVLPGGGAAFLQGLVLPIETHASTPALSLLTDTGQAIALIPTVLPPANVKTGVAYSLATPVICHQVQLLPTSPCRLWLGEIQWIAEPTPEQALTWVTQWTALGGKGYKHIPRIEPSYSAVAPVTLTITSQDGTSPAILTLPSTNGATEKILLTLTRNKGQLYRFSAVSSDPFQIFAKDFIVWVAEWGRPGSMVAWRKIGGAFGDAARI